MQPKTGLVLGTLIVVACLSVGAHAAPPVLVGDSGLQTRTIGPGAPSHTVGLQGVEQFITLDSGARQYGLRYGVALDPKDRSAAIPGEGYIGMSDPSNANWYRGGFFQLLINGQDIGRTYVHSVTGRSTGDRGYADFVFDHTQATVRIRFIAKGGDDALYCQALLEPKAEIKSLRLSLRCYPSGFFQNGERHVLTPTRDLPQGEKTELDLAQEWWLLYYDKVFDAGQVAPNGTGVGPCSVLFPGSQAARVSFSVGSYGIDTAMELKPILQDFRFVFFDYKGMPNAAAQADLRARADTLLKDLAIFQFTDPTLQTWDLAQKQAEVQQALARVPEDKQAAEQYRKWSAQLAAQLELIRQGRTGAIMGEAEATKLIGEWERGLPALKLQALLNEI